MATAMERETGNVIDEAARAVNQTLDALAASAVHKRSSVPLRRLQGEGCRHHSLEDAGMSADAVS